MLFPENRGTSMPKNELADTQSRAPSFTATQGAALPTRGPSSALCPETDAQKRSTTLSHGDPTPSTHGRTLLVRHRIGTEVSPRFKVPSKILFSIEPAPRILVKICIQNSLLSST